MKLETVLALRPAPGATATTIAAAISAAEATFRHPSGAIGEPYTVQSGRTVRVALHTADELWQRGLILHPQTGAVHPSRQPRPSRSDACVTFTVAGRTYTDGISAGMAISAAERAIVEASPPPSEDRSPKPRPHNCTGPMIGGERPW